VFFHENEAFLYLEIRTQIYLETVLLIRTLGRIRIILPDPDLEWDRNPGHADPDPAYSDRYQFQAHVFLPFS
jgi:hypothetical protein